MVGTARTARVLMENAVISRPNVFSVSVWASAVATSFGVAAKVAGINSGWLASPGNVRPLPEASLASLGTEPSAELSTESRTSIWALSRS